MQAKLSRRSNYTKVMMPRVTTICLSGFGRRYSLIRYVLWQQPSGRSIEAQAIVPDILVAAGAEDDIRRSAQPGDGDQAGHRAGAPAEPKPNQTIIRPPTTGAVPADFQLSYALDLLRSKMASRHARKV